MLVGRVKAFWLVLLSLAVAAVLSAGTLAAYSATDLLTGSIQAKVMVFQINGSGEQTQSLGTASLKPGESTSFSIVINTSGTEVALNVALSVTASGSNLPPGLSVTVDGTSVGASGTGTYQATFNGMEGSSRTVPVAVAWNATKEQLKALYNKSTTFTLSLSATATATQASTGTVIE